MTSATVMMNVKASLNRADDAPQGLIGAPLDRVDGPLKVAGRATYAAEFRPNGRLAYGYLVMATIAKGKVTGFDTGPALTTPGVIAVIDAGDHTLTQAANAGAAPRLSSNRDVDHFGQPLLLVVAESFEAARDGAARVRVDYAPEADGRFVLARHQDEAGTPGFPVFNKANQEAGDFAGAFAAAPVKLDVVYTTPSQIHAAMEPHAAIAEWDDDGKLTIHASYQMLTSVVGQLAKAIGVKADKIRMLSPYVGGGFGSKLGISPEAVMASVAARELKRPVKVVLGRHQQFHLTGRRSDSIQHIRLGAEANGRLTAIGHESIVSNRSLEMFYEPVGISTVSLYAAENRLVSHRQAILNLMISNSMRAPGEAIGMLAFESAIDELAHELGIDPIALRRINEPQEDPQSGVPFSTRKLVECLEDGAVRFGWDRRATTPASVRDGEWLVGMGVAGLARSNYLSNSSALVRITPDGRAAIETDHTDIGTGTYTILAQVAGDVLGLPIERIEVTLGDSALPVSSGSGGSWGAASGASSVLVACEALVTQIAERLKVDPEELTFKDGQVITGNRSIPLGEAIGGEAIEATGTIKPGATSTSHTQSAYGAVFAEVAVSSVTGEVRVRRMAATLAAGRILNPKTARSQLIGGLIWGLGGALTEEAALDGRHGLFVNHDLAEYHLPVNADAPEIDVLFLDEDDRLANPLGIKGLGELGICGAGAAIANAVFNATGVRVRNFPITLDKLLPGLPE